MQSQQQSQLHSPHYQQGESQQSYSYRSDASYDTQGPERERQRLVQEWAFDTQPPEVPSVLRAAGERPASRESAGRDSQTRERQQGYWPGHGPAGQALRPGLQTVDRSQSPLERAQHSSNQQYGGRMQSPYYPGQPRHEPPRQEPPRMGAMNIDHLIRENGHHQQQPGHHQQHPYGRVNHHSPLNEQLGRMESPDHLRNARPHEGYAEKQRMGSADQRMGSTDQRMPPAEQYRHPGPWQAVPYPPVPLTNMEDAEVLASMRYAQPQSRPHQPHPQLTHHHQLPHHPHQQIQQHRPSNTGPSPLRHLQRPSGRSSVVPGTPSERYDESSYISEQEAQGSTPVRPLTSAHHERPGPPREGSRVIAVASSPPLLGLGGRNGARRSPVREEEDAGEMDLEPTQRDGGPSSPVNVPNGKSPVKEKTPVKTPGKRKPAQHPTEQPRPTFTSKPAQETDEDTFILAEDRKVAFKKRSNAMMEECMLDASPLPAPGPAVGGEASPVKRKRSKASVVQAEPWDGKRVQARGELQGRKTGQVALGKTSAVGKSPAKKQKTAPAPAPVPAPAPAPQPVERTYLQQLFPPAGSSDTSIANTSLGNTTAEIVAKVPTYRRLQKTSVAGSSGPMMEAPLSEGVSLQGIDSYERRGEGGMMEDVLLEETMMPNGEASGGMPSRSVLVLDPTELTEREEEENGGLHPNKPPSQSRSTSLTPAPESEDEPRIETLIVPSPVRQKTYKSPAKKRRVRQVSTVRDATSSDAGDSEDGEPRRRKAGKKQGRVKKKIMSPTVSPPPSAKGKKQRKTPDTSVTSLSDAPVEERWDDVPPPLMKDDPRDRDFRPAAHSQLQPSPTRKISTRRESTTDRPILRAKRVLGSWNGDFYTGDLIGKEGHKYVLMFDDKETARVGLDDLRHCVFHIGDEIHAATRLKPKISDGTLMAIGTVDRDLDMSQPLMPTEKLLVRGKSGKTHEIEVQYCYFAQDNEDALDDRQFGKSELDELCVLSDSNTSAPKKPVRNGRSKSVVTNGVIPTTSRQHRSDARLDSTRPLYNFAFVITSNPNVADKSAQTKDLKKKIIKAGGQVMEDFFDLYPKPRGDSISADDIKLGRHYHKLHGIFLLVLNPKDAKSPCLTEKVMFALALGVPCLSASYIEELLQEEQVRTWHDRT